jgi:hypothetical protein
MHPGEASCVPSQVLEQVFEHVSLHDELHSLQTTGSFSQEVNNGKALKAAIPNRGSTFCEKTLKNSLLLCNSLFAIILIGIKIVIASHWAGTHASS